ncbi:hypothetical protein HKX48_008956 [Thoreauomyces humboldtii]|nr:hypothetical protein HKX48_008956 [Thoreauomyces humboldtii]
MPPKGRTTRPRGAAAIAAAKAERERSKALENGRSTPYVAQSHSLFTDIFNEGLAATQTELDSGMDFLVNYYNDIISGEALRNPHQILKTPGKARRNRKPEGSPSTVRKYPIVPIREISALANPVTAKRKAATCEEQNSTSTQQTHDDLSSVFSNEKSTKRARTDAPKVDRMRPDLSMAACTAAPEVDPTEGNHDRKSSLQASAAAANEKTQGSFATASPVLLSSPVDSGQGRKRGLAPHRATPSSTPLQLRASKRLKEQQKEITQEEPIVPNALRQGDQPADSDESDMEVEEAEGFEEDASPAPSEVEELEEIVISEIASAAETTSPALIAADALHTSPQKSPLNDSRPHVSAETPSDAVSTPVLGFRHSAVPLGARQLRVPTLTKFVAASRLAGEAVDEENDDVVLGTDLDSLFLAQRQEPQASETQSASSPMLVLERSSILETPRALPITSDDPYDDMVEKTPMPGKDGFLLREKSEADAADLPASPTGLGNLDLSIDFSDTPLPAASREFDISEEHPRSPLLAPSTRTLGVTSPRRLSEGASMPPKFVPSYFQSDDYRRVKENLNKSKKISAKPATATPPPLSTADPGTPNTNATVRVGMTPKSILRVRSARTSTASTIISSQRSAVPSLSQSESEYFDATEAAPSQENHDRSSHTAIGLLSSQGREMDSPRLNEKSVTFHFPSETDDSHMGTTDDDGDILTDLEILQPSDVEETSDADTVLGKAVEEDPESEDDVLQYGQREEAAVSTDATDDNRQVEAIERLESPPRPKPMFSSSLLGTMKNTFKKLSGASLIPQASQRPAAPPVRSKLAAKSVQAPAVVAKKTTLPNRVELAKERKKAEDEQRQADLLRKGEEKARKAEEKKQEKLKEQEAVKRKAAERQQAAAEKRAQEEKVRSTATAGLAKANIGGGKEGGRFGLAPRPITKPAVPAKPTYGLPSDSVGIASSSVRTIAPASKKPVKDSFAEVRKKFLTIVDENGDLPEPPSE